MRHLLSPPHGRLWASVTLFTSLFSGCASNGDASPTIVLGAADGGANFASPGREIRPPCRVITDCTQNLICLFEGTDLVNGHCVMPTGRCTPGDLVRGNPRSCYPNSRCEASRGEPRCTLTPTALQAFQTRERITTTGPSERDAVTAQSSVTLSWQPPSRVAGEVSTAVALIMSEPPRIRVETHQIENTGAIRWIWSSAEPGGASEGRVTFDLGHRGISHNGSPSAARWGRQGFLDNGIYYWFVFNVSNGLVTRSSAVTQFRVGPETAPGACTSAIECAGLGEVPESFACVERVCQRRCASEIDCAAVAGRCSYDRDFPSLPSSSRHSGFCVFSALPDGGAP